MTETLTTKERPVFVPASRPKKLPYLCAAAECVTCKATVSGDWGLVPDECDACDARRRELYYRALVQWAEAENGRLTAEVAALQRDADYYKWRLKEIVPLFQEARDALTAIPLASAKLHNLDLSLGIRMDRAGTRTREQFDADRLGEQP